MRLERATTDYGPRTTDIRRICLWSGPRNVSTAVLYAFAQRADTRIVDEPLYGHYLRVSGATHPGRDEVMAAQNCAGEEVVRDIILGATDRSVLFVKQMAHHLVDLDLSFLERTQNVFLIRDPAEMLPSLVNQIPNPDLRDTGLALQVDLYDRLIGLGRRPAVMDARLLLLDPRGVLTRLCGMLGLEFSPSMLSWPEGGLPEDGVWAPHWYHNIHRSTGFAPYRPKTDPFPERLRPLLDACRPYYEYLLQHAIKGPGSS
ncbi:MAG: hypothetical protein WBW88_12225 [Rhodothermales bacterium]